MDVENKEGCTVTGMMSFSESDLNELRKLRDNGEQLEPEELRALNRKELFDRNRKPEPAPNATSASHTGKSTKHGWNNPKQAIHQNAA